MVNFVKNFKGSPFDNFLVELWQSVLKNPSYKELTSLGQFILRQTEVLRVIYISYSHLGSPFRDPELPSLNRGSTVQEMVSFSDPGIKVALDYFSFVNELNQLGRVLKGKFKVTPTIPKYEEIYFFRNKIVEHWDDYMTCKLGGSAIEQGGRLPVPHSLSKSSEFAVHEKAKNDLINEFKAHELTIHSLDGFHHEDYANVIYPLLKRIDPTLKSFKKEHKTGIPENIVKALFEYEFPLPIYDVKKYCDDLINYFETLKLKK